MRILYLAGSAFPIRQARGIQIAHTVAALAERGHEIALVVGGMSGPDEEEAFAFYGLPAPPGVRLVRLPALRLLVPAGSRWNATASRLWTATHLAALRLGLPLVAAGEPFDVALARSLRVAHLAQTTPVVRSVPLVYEVHFLDSLNAVEVEGLASPRAQRWKRLERRVLDRALGVCAIASPARALLRERYQLSADKVAVIPDGTQPSPALSSPPREDDLVIYAGKLEAAKGVDVLIDALGLLPEVRLEIIGGLAPLGKADRDRERLARRAAEVGLGDRVHFTGPLSYPEVQRRLRRATAAAIPLRDTIEGRLFTSPLKAFDYMWSGTPIVASDLPSLRDVLAHEVNALLVPPEQPEALAAALRRLLGDATLRARLAARARDDVRGYTWQARAARLEAFLQTRLATEREGAAARGPLDGSARA